MRWSVIAWRCASFVVAAGVIALMLADPAGRFQMLAVTVVVGVIAIAGAIHQSVHGGKDA